MTEIAVEDAPRKGWLAANQELRLGPGLFWDAHMRVAAGSLVVIYGHAKGWMLVKAENGAYGWLPEGIVLLQQPCNTLQRDATLLRPCLSR